MKRKLAVSGSFYPAEQKELENLIDVFMRNKTESKEEIAERIAGNIKAIIVPHAGVIFSGPTAGRVYKLVKNPQAENISRVLLIGPSHYAGFDFAALAKDEMWEGPFGDIKIDQQINSELAEDQNFKYFNEAHLREHSLEVQLPFLQKALRNFSLVPILLGQRIDYENIAQSIIKIFSNKKISFENALIVVSTDLSHYLPQDHANLVDKRTIDSILKQDPELIKDNAEACGKEGVLILNEIAKKLGWRAKLIDYRTSGDVIGDKSAVVGYAGFVYTD